MQYLDKLGWPVEIVKGRWFHNLCRRIIHTRKIKRGGFAQTGSHNQPLNDDHGKQGEPTGPTKGKAAFSKTL